MSSHESEKSSHVEATASSDTDGKTSVTLPKSLDSVLALFKAGDDTSNFVAISLLRSILDERKELREDREIILRCWDSIPPKFLSRLLKAKSSDKRSKEEAQSMVGLAVAVIHVFVNLLPQEILQGQKFSDRADELIAAVPSSYVSNGNQARDESIHRARASKRKSICACKITLLGLSPTTVSQISQILLALNFPSLLFNNVAGPKGTSTKPSAYLFIKMLLIDVRSTIPSLQEKLNTPEYSKTSMRIAESFDITSNFIGYLVRSLDNDDDSNFSAGGSQLQLEASQLLQLRTDISETLSLTIEHLRDRFDASVAGAAGLHPSARNVTDRSSSNTRAITWQASNMSMAEDHLTLSEIRALSLWLREDDNDALRKEAAGIMDVLLHLYSEARSGADFSSPVLIALEGILTVPEGVEAFLNEEGWSIVYQGLQTALRFEENTAEQGTEAVRILLIVVESDITGPSKEDWMNVVDMAVEALQGSGSQKDERLDLSIAVSQLAVELLSKAPRNLRKRYSAQASKLLKLAGAKQGIADGEAEEGLMEVIEALEELGIRNV